MPEFMNIK